MMWPRVSHHIKEQQKQKQSKVVNFCHLCRPASSLLLSFIRSGAFDPPQSSHIPPFSLQHLPTIQVPSRPYRDPRTHPPKRISQGQLDTHTGTHLRGIIRHAIPFGRASEPHMSWIDVLRPRVGDISLESGCPEASGEGQGDSAIEEGIERKAEQRHGGVGEMFGERVGGKDGEKADAVSRRLRMAAMRCGLRWNGAIGRMAGERLVGKLGRTYGRMGSAGSSGHDDTGMR